MINRLENDPKNIATQSMGLDKSLRSPLSERKEVIKAGGLQKHVLEQIVELRKAQLRSQTNQGDVEVVNRKIEALINRLENDPRNRATQNMGGGVIKKGGLNKHVQEQIIELRKAQLRSQTNQGDVGFEMRNQQDNMEDKMKRQRRDMEDKKAAMETEIRSQEEKIRHLEREKRMSEHNQRMKQLRKVTGQ